MEKKPFSLETLDAIQERVYELQGMYAVLHAIAESLNSDTMITPPELYAAIMAAAGAISASTEAIDKIINSTSAN